MYTQAMDTQGKDAQAGSASRWMPVHVRGVTGIRRVTLDRFATCNVAGSRIPRVRRRWRRTSLPKRSSVPDAPARGVGVA